MATIVFNGGMTLTVSAPKEALQQLFTGPVGQIPAAWISVTSGDADALVNPLSIAYIADDADMPQAESSPSPFYEQRPPGSTFT